MLVSSGTGGAGEVQSVCRSDRWENVQYAVKNLIKTLNDLNYNFTGIFLNVLFFLFCWPLHLGWEGAVVYIGKQGWALKLLIKTVGICQTESLSQYIGSFISRTCDRVTGLIAHLSMLLTCLLSLSLFSYNLVWD